jgi:hypothetical protein
MWLGSSEENWPTATSTNKDKETTTQIDEEARKAAAVAQQVAAIKWNLERVSHFKRLVQRTAWILRFWEHQGRPVGVANGAAARNIKL